MSQSDSGKIRYKRIDLLRVFAAMGIIMVHVKSNTSYGIDVEYFSRFILLLEKIPFLFMMISAFSMCCGYFSSLTEGEISLDRLYLRRYQRIWPFFACLVLLDVILSPGKEALYEGVTDLTLAYGFLPNNQIGVIGVGWTLGIIFLFYMIFPYFCFLLMTKRRAWFVLVLSIVLQYISIQYWFQPNYVAMPFNAWSNMLYCFPFFISGGLLYLYRDAICNALGNHIVIRMVLLIVFPVIFLFGPNTVRATVPYTVLMLAGIMSAVISANSSGNNPSIIKFLSDLSMEIYLSHMVIFRGLERISIIPLSTGSPVISYTLTCIMVFAGTIVFSRCLKGILDMVIGAVSSHMHGSVR